MSMQLGIGSAQFGIDYGITNPDGKVSSEEVSRILREARKLGVTLLDTAYAYGDSEAVLGQTLPVIHGLDIVTKLPPLKKEQVTDKDLENFKNFFTESLKRLNQKTVYGLLVHHADDLLARDGAELWKLMERFKARGLVRKIGVSVYSEEQIRSILTRYPLDLVQLPINVLDQRLRHSGVLSNLKQAGVEIHARSIFLQGLLLMVPEELPPRFAAVKPLLEQYHQVMSANHVNPLEAALLFIRSIEDIDVVIIGVTSLDQLREVQAAYHCEVPHHSLDFSPYACTDEQIINPALWPV